MSIFTYKKNSYFVPQFEYVVRRLTLQNKNKIIHSFIHSKLTH